MVTFTLLYRLVQSDPRGSCAAGREPTLTAVRSTIGQSGPASITLTGPLLINDQ